jgi:hypothetical protein
LRWILIPDESEGFASSLQLLEGALDQDLQHLVSHTEMLTRAARWQRNGYKQ